MKIVIFAGGSGKRFWPASRLSNPKQFQNVNSDKPLVRTAYEQLLNGFDKKDIFFSTGKVYEKEIKSIFPELPNENFILEPSMRDTGPAVTLAVSYLNKKFKGETIAVRWSDHLIRDTKTFIDSLNEADEQAKMGKIVFIAVPPRFASPHRGYIKFGKEIKKLNNTNIKLTEFLQFDEKPNVEVANKYLESKEYAWNPGYWVFKPENYLNKIKLTNRNIHDICEDVVNNNFNHDSLEKFSNLEKISADYIFAEKVFPNEAVVLLTEMGWSDVGEWIALKEALEKNKEDNVTKGNVYPYNTSDSIIYNYQDEKFVVTIGLNGFVIVNTPDVVAIFPKEDNTKLKELLKKFEGTDYEKYL